MKNIIETLKKSILWSVASFTMTTAVAQNAEQQFIVRKITHSANEPTVPIQDVGVVVDGLSQKSNSSGKLSLQIRLNSQRDYLLDDVRVPQGSTYILAYPQLKEKIFLSRNAQVIAMISPEEMDTIAKNNYKRLLRQYRQQGNKLLNMRNQLEEMQLDMKENSDDYRKTQMRMDSLQQIINKYYKEEDKQNITKELRRIANELTMTDYQSLDSTNMKIFNLKKDGEWEEISKILDDIIRDPEAFMREGLLNKKNAEAIAAATAKDLEKRFDYMENAILAFKMMHKNDSVSNYYRILTNAAPENWQYLYDAGNFEQEYMGHYQKALDYHRKALLLPVADSLKAQNLNCIGTIYQQQGIFDLALQHHTKALQLYQTVSNEKHPKMAICYHNIGSYYHAQNNYPKAAEYYQKALNIRKAIYGECHPEIANSYNNIGGLYNEEGNYTLALDYQRKALDIRTAVFGGIHQDVALSYNNLGSIYYGLGNYPSALNAFMKSLKIKQQIYSEMHPDIALSYNNIGNTYIEQGNLKLALKYLQKSLKIKIFVFGKKHQDVAMSYNNIGSIFHYSGHFDSALKYYEKALNIYKAIYGDRHANTALAYVNMGAAYHALQHHEKALTYYQKGLDIRQKIYKGDHPSIATLYNNIGLVYDDMGDAASAIKMLEKALAIRRSIFGDCHIRIAYILENIGRIHYNQNQLADALEYLQQAYDIYKKTEGEKGKNAKNAFQIIQTIYQKSKKQTSR